MSLPNTDLSSPTAAVSAARTGPCTHAMARCRRVWLQMILIACAACWAHPPSCPGAESAKPRSSEPGTNSRAGSNDNRIQLLMDLVRRMDANRSGSLEPEEISDDARAYFQSWARLAGLDPTRPLSIEALEAALRQYYRDRDLPPPRAARRPRQPLRGQDSTVPTAVPGFGQVEDLPPIPGFGADAEQMAGVQSADLERATERFKQYDVNHDGVIDRREARRGRWSGDPFQYDANHDDRLTPRELAVRYARRRVSEARGQSPRSPRTDPRGRERGSSQQDRRRGRPEEQQRRGQDPQTREAWYLSGSIMQRYDTNHNGALDEAEWRNLGEKAASADADRRGRVDRRELAEWLLRVADRPEQDVSRDLPEWFRRRDLNTDHQVTMAEFTDEWNDEKVQQFDEFDANQDGIITRDECLGAGGHDEGTYHNRQLEIIPAGTTVYSDIVVPDGEPVANLDVQISITHTNDSQLDAFLIGPYGERVELFTAVGRSDDHFDNTFFDDEAPRSITQGSPPFRGRYRPEAVDKRQPSLRQFYGKPIDGTWTLMIQATRSDRPGALHGWSLITSSAEDEGENEAPPRPRGRSNEVPPRWRGRTNEGPPRRRGRSSE